MIRHLLLLLAIAIFPVRAHSQTEQTVVSVNDLGRSVIVVGRLGRPLGTMATVTGRWVPKLAGKPAPKYNPVRFRVETVDGHPLLNPSTFDAAALHILGPNRRDVFAGDLTPESVVGEIWTIRAFETGRFIGEPDEYFNYRGPIATMRNTGFKTSIVGFRIPNGGSPGTAPTDPTSDGG